MNHKTYQPENIAEEGCWFSVDIVDEHGAEAAISTIEAESDDDIPFGQEHLAECKRRAYLISIQRLEKLAQKIRSEAISLGYDASPMAILDVCLESGEGLDAEDRAFRQGYIFNHSGKVHAVPALTGGGK